MTPPKSLPKIISILFLAIGIFLLLQSFWPAISFKIQEIVLTNSGKSLTTPQSFVSLPGVSIQSTADNFPLIISANKRVEPATYQYFNLTMNSAGIHEEVVYVDSNDLSKGLIHLPGAPLPGEKGNVFISGHSTLPLFTNNQKALFAKLPNAKIGDTLQVSAMGTKFSYRVIEIKIVSPTDISVISPPDETGRYITLMTCVPPGFNTKRLIVVGKLI